MDSRDPEKMNSSEPEKWIRENPENGLETRRALEIGPAYRDSERRCGRQSKQMLAPHESLPLIVRHVFLIHGSAIKTRRNRLRNGDLAISNRR
jgi:hypothetical protein